MKLFKIVKDNQKSLRIRSTDVSFPLDENTKETLFNMLEYLKLSQDDEFASKNNIRSGVGLAAPQIGINKNMLAMYYYDEKNVLKQYILINPKIVSESVKQAYIAYGEGCLSVDKEHNGYVYRPYKVKVQAYDLLKEKNVEYVFTGFGSMCVQHEIDHLTGILFYDHIDKKDPFKEDPDAIKIQ